MTKQTENSDSNIYRKDEPRREMARLPAIAGIVTATGVGSIALLGWFFLPDWGMVFFAISYVITAIVHLCSKGDDPFPWER